MTVLFFFLFQQCFAGDRISFTTEAQNYIFAHQHPAHCRDRRWVQPEPLPEKHGIGSEIHIATGWLAWAMNNDAIFLWPKTTRWVSSLVCVERSFECLFATPTNCSLDELAPERRIDAPSIYVSNVVKDSVPTVFASFETAPYPLYYWWRTQATFYLTKVCVFFRFCFGLRRHPNSSQRTASFQHVLDGARLALSPPVSIPCGSVCVYVRHGDKSIEMELLPWSRFRGLVAMASELVMVQAHQSRSSVANPYLRCRQRENATTSLPHVFLMTDDAVVVRDALADLGARLHYIHATTLTPPHETGGSWNDHSVTHNLIMSMLNLDFCLQCDAIVSQRTANFARLIDELRLTAAEKATFPFIEAGKYEFSWR